ncbi:MAG: hypothetical protein AAF530_19415 [Pseudomonadota bacterium]
MDVLSTQGIIDAKAFPFVFGENAIALSVIGPNCPIAEKIIELPLYREGIEPVFSELIEIFGFDPSIRICPCRPSSKQAHNQAQQMTFHLKAPRGKVFTMGKCQIPSDFTQ